MFIELLKVLWIWLNVSEHVSKPSGVWHTDLGSDLEYGP
jgi:hypothetical protein